MDAPQDPVLVRDEAGNVIGSFVNARWEDGRLVGDLHLDAGESMPNFTIYRDPIRLGFSLSDEERAARGMGG